MSWHNVSKHHIQSTDRPYVDRKSIYVAKRTESTVCNARVNMKEQAVRKKEGILPQEPFYPGN
uniref:Uncharacterized protein n=1 Tax=Salix viminalis TaxID=40686 RepID=A0A6N2L343_SALVM